MKLQSTSRFKRLIYKISLLIPDSLYVRLKFRKNMGRWPDLKHPKTFNEKICWLRLYDHNPLYTKMVDKYEVKKIVASIIGEEYIIPTLGVWTRAEDIDFTQLPNQFVLKCNHDSGRVIICKDKSSFDTEWARREMAASLKRDFYAITREWPYKNVPRKIIAEKYMVDPHNPNKSLTDYKFFCFNGKADCVMLCLDRENGHPKFYFFDRHWNFKRYNKMGKTAPNNFTITPPPSIEKMFEIADKLSAETSFLRVDLYNINGTIYFGETTFYPDGGTDPNIIPETDSHFGNMIKLNIGK